MPSVFGPQWNRKDRGTGRCRLDSPYIKWRNSREIDGEEEVGMSDPNLSLKGGEDGLIKVVTGWTRTGGRQDAQQ